MENKKKAVSYYRKSKYGKSYTEADLDALYQKSYNNYDDVDLIEYIFDEKPEFLKRLIEEKLGHEAAWCFSECIFEIQEELRYAQESGTEHEKNG